MPEALAMRPDGQVVLTESTIVNRVHLGGGDQVYFLSNRRVLADTPFESSSCGFAK